jgi:hypothetical protein
MRASSWIAVVVGCGVAAGLAVVVASLDAPPEPSHGPDVVASLELPNGERAERRAERKAARLEKRREARRARRAELQAERQARREAKQEKEEKTPRLPPDERAEARAESRSAALDGLVMRLEDYGVDNEWSDSQIDQVADLVVEGSESVSLLLEAVDRGELSWEEVKGDVRELRFEQARRVEGVLGPEEFRRFSEAMGFERFQGDEWVRGRTSSTKPE